MPGVWGLVCLHDVYIYIRIIYIYIYIMNTYIYMYIACVPFPASRHRRHCSLYDVSYIFFGGTCGGGGNGGGGIVFVVSLWYLF